MADYNRKREPCAAYKREGRTKQNVYECLNPALGLEHQGEGGGWNYRSGGRQNQDLYECCPPTPVELKCSVCWTAERDGCNLWTCVPFVSYSVLCGPTLADLLVHFLNLLPLTFLACLGIAHPRCCSAKPKPPVRNCSPERMAQRCPPVNRCAPVNICPDKRETRNACPCPRTKMNIDRTNYQGGDAPEYSCRDGTMAWLHNEYRALAQELAEIRTLTSDGENGNGDSCRDLANARNYVLDRLAEMMAKREEIERRKQKKK